MASGGAKNIGLTIIAVAAIGGAIYLLAQSMGGGGTESDAENIYFILDGTENDEVPTGITMSMGKYKSHVANREAIMIDGSAEVTRAGICPEGKYYPLGGHGAQPETCPCGNSLEGINLHGERNAL